jgi:hypothetical protein
VRSKRPRCDQDRAHLRRRRRDQIEGEREVMQALSVERDPGVTDTATDLFLRPLHGDPRWRPFLQRMGLA